MRGTSNLTAAAPTTIVRIDFDWNLSGHTVLSLYPEFSESVTPNKNPQAEKISLGIYLLPKLLTRFGQVFWLVDLPTDRAFPCRFVCPDIRHSGFLRGSSSLTAAGPRRSCTDFPFQTCTDQRLFIKYHRFLWLLSSNDW